MTSLSGINLEKTANKSIIFRWMNRSFVASSDMRQLPSQPSLGSIERNDVAHTNKQKHSPSLDGIHTRAEIWSGLVWNDELFLYEERQFVALLSSYIHFNEATNYALFFMVRNVSAHICAIGEWKACCREKSYGKLQCKSSIERLKVRRLLPLKWYHRKEMLLCSTKGAFICKRQINIPLNNKTHRTLITFCVSLLLITLG